jgi:hypothetical protein
VLGPEYIAWLLAQKREEGLIPEIMATDDAGKEEFFTFYEWVPTRLFGERS